jgi:hypothetical protein
MIAAHKYLNLDLSVINVSALIISKLKGNNLLKYDELLGAMVSVLGEKVRDVFPYSLNFLFLLGKISYLDKLDAFQLNEIN